jgi:hypothetical protein
VTPESPVRAAVPAARRFRPLRLVLVLVAGVATLLCMGGVGVAVTVYDNATAIDRGEPDVIVDNYLRSLLVERNDVRAESLECAQDAGLAPIHTFRRDIEGREKAFDVSIDVSWGALQAVPGNAQYVYSTDLTRTIQGAERSTQTWRFTVVDESGGWRVCAAERVS